MPEHAPDAAGLLARLRARGESVALAESLTGGLLCDALVEVPGASDVVVGGVVAYSAQVKQSVLGVSPEVLSRTGTISAETAGAMARGARRALGATWAVATTGIAGPRPAEGHPVGTAFVAVAGPDADADAEEATRSQALHLRGTREQIRRGCVDAALMLLHRVLSEH